MATKQSGHANSQKASALHKVFGTFELAESIFLGVSMRDVLVSVQRTCRTWKAIIAGSTPIQQALFLRPISDVRLRHISGGRWADTEESPGCAVIEHPVITKIFGNFTFAKVRWLDKVHPQGSWREQLVTQPPVIQLVLTNDGKHHKVVAKGAGVTLGELDLLKYRQEVENLALTGFSTWKSSGLAEETGTLRTRILDL